MEGSVRNREVRDLLYDILQAIREGNRLIIDPVQYRSLLALLAIWEPFEEDFPEIGDLPPEPIDP